MCMEFHLKALTMLGYARPAGHLSLTKEEGLVRDIGLSNYTVRHLTELLGNNHGLKPSVNQVEWHPGCFQNELLDLCSKEGILLEAHTSLGGTGNSTLLVHPVVICVAETLSKSRAQVLLRWSLQQNVAVIPKSRSTQHLDANLDLNFVISNEDIYINSVYSVCRRCPMPRFHILLLSHWPSCKFLSLIAFLIPSCQLFLGRPLALRSRGVHSIVCLGSLESDILCT